LIRNLSERVENVGERAARIREWRRCFLMEWVDPPLCSGHWGPELVEIAGGHDPLGRKHQPSAEVEWQNVLDACPEVIVLALCGYDISRARCDYELLVKFPGFDSIPAVRSGEIYVVNASAYFSRPGPRIVDSLEILAGILHPNEFSEFVSRGSDDLRVVCMSQGARTEPSGANLQPWQFVAVNDPKVKQEIRVAAEAEEKEFYEHRAPKAWLDALAVLGTDWQKPFLEIAPWLIAVFAQPFRILPDG